MIFTSYQFILFFLPTTFFVYFWLNKLRLGSAAKSWLVLASLFFYGWWEPAYLPLILVSMLVNYVLGATLSGSKDQLGLFWNSKRSGKQPSRRRLLVFGVCFNLSLLGYFKYANFFVDNISLLGANVSIAEIALPLAISFFTFQQIAYLVDNYRRETEEYDFLNYALFVTFFPGIAISR